MTATIINFDRCISMFFHMKYKSIVTNTRLKVTCIAQFTLAVALSIIRFNIPMRSSGFYCGNNVSENGNRVIAHVLLIANIMPYIVMLWHLKMQRNAEGRAVEVETTIGKITLISSFLVICYAPGIVMGDIRANFPSSAAVRLATSISDFLALTNSIMNPVLYAWRFYEVRYQFLRLVCFWNSRKVEILRQARQQRFATFEINTRETATKRSDENITCYI